jgi:tetratricopeptide (TPR) repeat protein
MRQQWIAAICGVIILSALYFFGRTKPYPKGNTPGGTASSVNAGAGPATNVENLLAEARKSLTPSQQARITALENSISRGDLKNQKIDLYSELAVFWRDSARQTVPYLWYLGEKAKLENSEKNLNFAAQSYLEELKSAADPAARTWMADQAQGLFGKVLEINPANDSAKVGWGSTFIFGASGASSPMEGIMKIREVAEKDSSNMYAQFMLGYGAMMTGQFDRAIERLSTVARKQPQNTEAVFLLAEAYERSGNQENAVKWYSEGRKQVSNPELLKAIDEKIKSLK